jgi:ATP-dependent clp protease regulatory subunit
MEWYGSRGDELRAVQERFAALTEGFSFTELNGLRKLCKNEGFAMKDMCGVIDLYKYGVRENPWRSLDIEKLRGAEEYFRSRVKGQDAAIIRTLDVVKRAVTGLSGLQGSSHTRPKGVLFFAGPTGTGKTETAKTLAAQLFGDDSCCIRFDMSEYSQSHSDQKLLGAPPGYVGYEAGGQLTNAVRNAPFSILLFDEIEKAHPSVMDKFLQILEDGRMTDGQGNTVYFSECVIIFTSNLGIYTRAPDGGRQQNVTPDMPYPEVQKRVRSAIEEHFKLELGRPEILNRIGENIVVFDYIRPEAARKILRSQVDRIFRDLSAERRIEITISERAYSVLLEHALGNLENGGRGIGNIVGALLIDPLSRFLFDNGIFSDARLEITEIDAQAAPACLECRRS